MFHAVSSKPDLVAQEHEILAQWRDRRTFARLRAQNAGGPKWSFLDGPITANNPMGVHHAWGRAYKDLYQRFHAMLGEDQRYQNGFDCQGLWVEVNVERDLGFTSKRDIEAYGIDRFVTLCKQRVLTYAARQTEQSIRLGMWMDWNDPDELRRLHDLLGEDPAQVATIDGPDGPVTDTVEMLVGRLGHARRPAARTSRSATRTTTSSGGSSRSATGAAGCTRATTRCRGARAAGPGLSQTEVNEGYQDKDDPGLTVRFPLVDRPGEALLVWTTTPWTLTSNVAAAVGAELRYVRVRQDDESLLAGQGHAQAGAGRAVHGRGGGRRRRARRAGATPARSTTCRPSGRRSRPGPATSRRPRTSTASSPGTRSARTRAPASSTSPRAAAPRTSSSASRWGCRSSAPLDEAGIVLDGFGSLSGRDVRDVAEPIVEHLKRTGRFYRLETIHHRYPHCWRCGTPLVFRLVDEWYISMGPVYDGPRETLTPGAGRREPALPDHGGRRPDPLDPRLRVRARARLAPQHARLDDQQEALLGPGAADLRLRGVRHGRGHRRPRGAAERARSRAGTRSRGTRRIGRYVDAVPDRLPGLRRAGRAHQGRRQPVARRRDRAVLDAPLPRGARVLGEVVPGRLHHRELSRASSATGSTRCWRCRRSCAASRRSRRSSGTPSSSARTAARCTRAGATRSTSTRPPSGWASTSCAGCSPRRGPRRTSPSAGTPPTRRAASCSCSGTSTRSS